LCATGLQNIYFSNQFANYTGKSVRSVYEIPQKEIDHSVAINLEFEVPLAG